MFTHTVGTGVRYEDVDAYVAAAQEAMRKKYGWKPVGTAEMHGKYGHDTLANSVAAVLKLVETETFEDCELEDFPIDELADAVHRGWASTYKAWAEVRPWEARTGDPPDVARQRPHVLPGSAGDARAKLADTNFKDLSAEEAEKDRVIAKAVLEEWLAY